MAAFRMISPATMYIQLFRLFSPITKTSDANNNMVFSPRQLLSIERDPLSPISICESTTESILNQERISLEELKRNITESRLSGCPLSLLAEYRDSFDYLIRTLHVLNQIKKI